MLALAAEEISAKDVPLVGVGLESYSVEVLRHSNSNLSLLLDQNVPLQAYLAVLQACLGGQYASIGPHIDTPFRILDRDNLADAEDPDVAAFVQRF